MTVDQRHSVPQPFNDDSDEGMEARQLQVVPKDAGATASEAPSLYEVSRWFHGLTAETPYNGEDLDSHWDELMDAMPHEHELLERLDTGSISATHAAVWAGEHGDSDRARRFAHLVVNYNARLLDLGITPALSDSVNTAQYLR